jgi:hypothetical protein
MRPEFRRPEGRKLKRNAEGERAVGVKLKAKMMKKNS